MRGEKHLLEHDDRPGGAARAAPGAGGAARHPQDARLRALPRSRRGRRRTRYVDWFEPDHFIVEANAPFFVRRFATMVWSILTPYRSAHWTGAALEFGPGASPADVPDDDRLEAYWRAYFSSIFNPARLKIGAMTSEMPRKYWRNLPEAAAIPELIRTAPGRVDRMVERTRDLTAEARPRRAAAAAAAAPQARACSKRRAGGRRLPPLPALGAGDADRVRRGPGRRAHHDGRRAARRPGRPGRPPLRRPGRPDARPRDGRGRHRPARTSTSPTRSSTSNSSRAASGASTRSPAAREIAACKFWLELEREEIQPGDHGHARRHRRAGACSAAP